MSITWIARIIFSHATEALNLMNTYHESLTTTLSWNTCGYGQKNSLYRPIPPKKGLMWLDTKNNSSHVGPLLIFAGSKPSGPLPVTLLQLALKLIDPCARKTQRQFWA